MRCISYLPELFQRHFISFLGYFIGPYIFISLPVPDGLAPAQHCSWARWAGFYIAKKICILVNTMHTYLFFPFLWLKAGENGWMAADDVLSYLRTPHFAAIHYRF